MTERYLQSLAILLAGLFSAERLRSTALSPGASPPTSEQETANAGSAQAKTNQH